MTGRALRVLRAIFRPPALGLAVVVVAWWLLIAGLVSPMLPSPVSSATTGAPLAPGYRARIAQRGIRDWPVPTSRAAFDEFHRGFAAADEDAIDNAFRITEWVAVNH